MAKTKKLGFIFYYCLFLSVLVVFSVQITLLASTTPRVACGFYHSLALKSDGTVWAWGYNSFAQLGDGTSADKNTPVQVGGLSNVIAIAGGHYHSVALKSDGTVWTWGDNGYGQLGDGTFFWKSTPVQVNGLSSVIAIACGRGCTLALKSDGTVWAWGDNSSGQLGDGTTTNKTTPVQVSGLSGVTAISAGALHNLALQSDDTVWAWGENGYGQLGDGTYNSKSTPGQVSSLSGVTAITCGESHSLALKSDGIVMGWGSNSSGQLGLASYSQSYATPVRAMSSVSGITAIVGASGHSVVLKSDGTVWASGANSKGQLGDGTTTDSYTPVQVSSLSGVSTIASRLWHNLAVKTDGTVWAWGGNNYGQLGDGTTTNRTTPVQVNINLTATTTNVNGTLLTSTQTGSVRVSITPQEAVDAGAQWKLTTESSWHNSGNIIYNLSLGTYYVEFSTITGWITPSNKEVTISVTNPDIWIDSDPYIRSATPTPTPTTTDSFQVTNSLMTGISRDEFYGEYNNCKTPPEKNTFLDTDSQAAVWFSFENSTSGDVFKWEWYKPADVLYTQSNTTNTYTSGCWMNSISIKSSSPASMPGEWKVKVYRNDQLLFTETFTIIDTTPPTVSSTNPANGATSVAVNKTISATFSEAMDSSTISTTTFTLSGGVTGSVSYDSASKVTTFTPSSNLSYSTTYTATITTGVKDSAGNAMSSNYSWSFTTTAATATPSPTPTPTTTSPTPTPTATPTPTSFVVNESRMTDITSDEFYGEYDGCKTPPEKNTFLDTDSQATVWFSFANSTSGDVFKWEWYEPGDILYYQSNATNTYTNGCWFSILGIKNGGPASMPGAWKVKVYRNDQLLFTETFTIQRDATVPTGSISINSGTSYTNSATVTLTLSATDDVGITGYYLSTSSSTPSASDSGWTSVLSNTSYSASVYYLLSNGDGGKTVYVWFKDTDGKVSDAANDSITLDTTAPTVTITSPTSSSTYTTTNSVISLGGSASDSTSGISNVTWSSNKEGGTASGTTSWSISNISLSIGNNTITVTATDNAGNVGKDTITVTYRVQTPTPTATPTPVSCDVATAITSSSSTVTVAKGNSTTVTITITGAGGCRVESDTVSASSSDRSVATVSPSKATTNASGQATFTITGSQKGSAKVTFRESTANLKTKVQVKVTK